MTAPLKPMTLGEILDRTLQIYRSRFLVFAGISALPALAMLALQLANVLLWRLVPDRFGRTAAFGFTSQSLLYLLAVYVVSLLVHLVFWPAMALAASRACFGERPSIRSAIAMPFARWAGCLWLAIAHWGVVLVLPEAAGFALLVGFYFLADKLGFTFFDQFGPQLFAVTLALGWAAFLWLSAELCFAFPIWSLEGLSVFTALRRSWALVHGARTRLVFARVAPAVTAWLFNLVVSRLLILVIFVLLRSLPGSFRYSALAFTEVNLLVTALISTVFGPLFPIALTLLYYDQRVRKEAYDIELMMTAAGMETSAVLPSETRADANAAAKQSGN